MQSEHRHVSALIKEFLNTLRVRNQFQPFLELDKVPLHGIGDFWLLNQSGLNLSIIERRLSREKVYLSVDQFVDDMIKMIEGVQDYFLDRDPLQQSFEGLKRIVRQFARATKKKKKVEWSNSNSNSSSSSSSKEGNSGDSSKEQIDSKDSREIVVNQEREESDEEQTLRLFDAMTRKSSYCSLISFSRMHSLGTVKGSRYTIDINGNTIGRKWRHRDS